MHITFIVSWFSLNAYGIFIQYIALSFLIRLTLDFNFLTDLILKLKFFPIATLVYTDYLV